MFNRYRGLLILFKRCLKVHFGVYGKLVLIQHYRTEPTNTPHCMSYVVITICLNMLLCLDAAMFVHAV